MLYKSSIKVVFYLLAVLFFCGSTINAQTQEPIISSLSPSFIVARDLSLNIILKGSNFLPDSKVYFNNSEKKSTYVSSSEMSILVDAIDVLNPGLFVIKIIGPNGEKSNDKIFTVNSPTPTLIKISPSSTLVNNEGFNITVNGTNFVSGSVIRFSGQPKNTNYISASQLSAYIPPTDLLSTGTYDITVSNPNPGMKISNIMKITVNNPLPGIKNIEPNLVSAGDSKTTLLVFGSNFVPYFSTNKSGSLVYLNNIPIYTIFNSVNQLTAYIPESLLINAINYSVSVLNPAPGGGFSNIKDFSVRNPVPTISNISKTSVDLGSNGFDLIIIGSKFKQGAIVNFNGSTKKTTYNSSNKLIAFIEKSDLLKAGNYNITVTNPSPGGGRSNVKQITVNNRLPSISNISPKSAPLDSPSFNLRINGSNFIPSSTINFNGSPRNTIYNSATQLMVEISDSDLSLAGLYNITVTNPAPGGGNSNSEIFSINNPVPFIDDMSINSILVGGPDFFLTVYGSNFTQDTVINFNNNPLIISYYDSVDIKKQATALFNSSNIKNPGTYYITATNPPPGGGISNKKAFTVVESSKNYTYSACYFNQCRLFSTPIPLSSSCQIDIGCIF